MLERYQSAIEASGFGEGVCYCAAYAGGGAGYYYYTVGEVELVEGVGGAVGCGVGGSGCLGFFEGHGHLERIPMWVCVDWGRAESRIEVFCTLSRLER